MAMKSVDGGGMYSNSGSPIPWPGLNYFIIEPLKCFIILYQREKPSTYTSTTVMD